MCVVGQGFAKETAKKGKGAAVSIRRRVQDCKSIFKMDTVNRGKFVSAEWTAGHMSFWVSTQ